MTNDNELTILMQIREHRLRYRRSVSVGREHRQLFAIIPIELERSTIFELREAAPWVRLDRNEPLVFEDVRLVFSRNVDSLIISETLP